MLRREVLITLNTERTGCNLSTVSERSEMNPNLVDQTCDTSCLNDNATTECYYWRAVLTVFTITPDQIRAIVVKRSWTCSVWKTVVCCVRAVLERTMTVQATSVPVRISMSWRRHHALWHRATSTTHFTSHTAPSDLFVSISTDSTSMYLHTLLMHAAEWVTR